MTLENLKVTSNIPKDLPIQPWEMVLLEPFVAAFLSKMAEAHGDATVEDPPPDGGATEPNDQRPRLK